MCREIPIVDHWIAKVDGYKPWEDGIKAQAFIKKGDNDSPYRKIK